MGSKLTIIIKALLICFANGIPFHGKDFQDVKEGLKNKIQNSIKQHK